MGVGHVPPGGGAAADVVLRRGHRHRRPAAGPPRQGIAHGGAKRPRMCRKYKIQKQSMGYFLAFKFCDTLFFYVIFRALTVIKIFLVLLSSGSACLLVLCSSARNLQLMKIARAFGRQNCISTPYFSKMPCSK